jgi:predicted DNA-binding transcriptional regulator YafY
MSFAKALDLLRLADMAAARHRGVGLAEIEAEFAVDRRTAQRMARALEAAFPEVEIVTDDSRRRFWKLREAARLSQGAVLRDDELAALGLAIRRARREGAEAEARALAALRDRLLAALPRPQARRIEADAEAVLEAHGHACRPGPVVRVEAGVLEAVAAGLKAPCPLAILYAGPADNGPRERIVEPWGLLIGTRRYLVARERDGDGVLRHFRLDRIRQARPVAGTFVRDPGFDLRDHAARAFGSWHAEAERGEVVWRFAPSAAATAREFLFHPRQTATDEPDGSLTVRFEACGWLEMAWHLYQWGDRVEVLAPEPLRRMVEGHRRGDLPALP